MKKEKRLEELREKHYNDELGEEEEEEYRELEHNKLVELEGIID